MYVYHCDNEFMILECDKSPTKKIIKTHTNQANYLYKFGDITAIKDKYHYKVYLKSGENLWMEYSVE